MFNTVVFRDIVNRNPDIDKVVLYQELVRVQESAKENHYRFETQKPLLSAMSWENTPQDHAFWYSLHNREGFLHGYFE